MRRLVPALALLAALVVAGCQVGAGTPPGAVHLTVTDDFGTRSLVQTDQPKRGGDDTVMRLLQRNAEVGTRYGGGFVQSIEGLKGGRSSGEPVDWFYYVNGVEQGKGAASTDVHRGDRIWWDRHAWGATMRVPAVVGSFPEPFVHGVGGERLPTRVECADGRGATCKSVVDALVKLGLVPGKSQIGTQTEAEVVRVLVGPWRSVAADLAVGQIAKGPRKSGVFARMSEDGRTLAALDPRGRVARTYGAGTGLVAAVRIANEQPTWVVTGTDDEGVAAAARAFVAGESALADKFALAVSADRGVPLPVVAKGSA